jgi:hypothetical protein
MVYDAETTTHIEDATLSVDYDAETSTYTKAVTLSVVYDAETTMKLLH